MTEPTLEYLRKTSELTIDDCLALLQTTPVEVYFDPKEFVLLSKYIDNMRKCVDNHIELMASIMRGEVGAQAGDIAQSKLVVAYTLMNFGKEVADSIKVYCTIPEKEDKKVNGPGTV